MYGYGYYSMFDPTMILVLIGVFLSLGASVPTLALSKSGFGSELLVSSQPASQASHYRNEL